MTTKPNACDTVAAIYEKKREEGLVDIKFLLQNRAEASYSQACEELAAFDTAESSPLNFGDLKWDDCK